MTIEPISTASHADMRKPASRNKQQHDRNQRDQPGHEQISSRIENLCEHGQSLPARTMQPAFVVSPFVGRTCGASECACKRAGKQDWLTLPRQYIRRVPRRLLSPDRQRISRRRTCFMILQRTNAALAVAAHETAPVPRRLFRIAPRPSLPPRRFFVKSLASSLAMIWRLAAPYFAPRTAGRAGSCSARWSPSSCRSSPSR